MLACIPSNSPYIELWMHYHELCLPYWALCQLPWHCVSAIYPEIVSSLAMQSHFYILRSLIPFLPGGDFPPSVDILHMYPCIEHRYVPLLGTSLFALNDTRLLLVCNYKASLFFFQAFQITKKDQKNKKTKKPDKKRYYLWQLSSHVAFE